ncbi:hypothetical protein FGRMN_5758 [Fusarium graminum]|nr:hypothetical protein FGRMN_5758 [Fusarium graminum]
MPSQWPRPFGRRHVPDIPEERKVTAEQDAGFFSKLWFAWLSPLMTIGYRRHLERNDIWTVSDARLMDTLQPTLHAAFRRRVLSQKRLPLLWALYEVFKFDFWLGALSQFVVSTLQVMTPFTLRFLIQWVQGAYPDGYNTHSSTSVSAGIGYVLGIAALQMLQTFASSQFYYRGMLLGGQTRSALIAMAFNKSLKLSNRAKAGGQIAASETNNDGIAYRTDEKGWSNGRVMSLVSNDTARIEQALAAFHLSWLSLYQLILTVALLVYNLGWTALPGAATLIFGLAAVTYATRPLVASRNRINIVTDQRVTLTQEILQSIRFVKYFGWESFFQERLGNIRVSETRALRIMHLIRCAVGTLAQFLPVLAIMITFIVYAVVHGSLDPAVVFSSLAMLYLLRVPTNWLPVSLSLAADAVQSIKRIEGFLLAEEVQAQTVPDPGLVPAAKLSNASFTWEGSPMNEEPEKETPKKNFMSRALRKRRVPNEEKIHPVQDNDVTFSLNDISFEYQRGELVGIIGSVGSGKTSLLSALAGDMRQTDGTMQFAADRAYCPQYAWIQNASVRDNITFGKPLDHKLYSDVVRACALLPDFELLPHGDMTEIGERGVTLSGGQKQRINIARAIYSGAGVVLLDDPLSAVDAHVGTHIFNEAICGLLKSKCRFLATHHLHLLSRFDKIIWMVDGRIEARGTYEELMKSYPAFASLVAVGGHQQGESESTDDSKGGSTGPDSSNTTTKAGVLMQEETKMVDSVPFSVYVSWLRASGTLWNGLAMVVGQLLFRASSILGGLWLSWWVDNKYGLTRGQNIGIYAGLSLAQCVLVFSSSLITCLVCIKSSQVMSNNALWQTLRAPMSFFDTTPLGRIIYRFTRDIDALDNNLVVAVQQLLINVAALLGSYILIVAYFYYFAIALVFGATALWWCISYYRSSARELRRHQLILDGVVFARLNEALIGAACIRAYDRELQFVKLVHEAIDDMDSANFLTFASHNWLSVRLDNIGIFLNFITGTLVVTNALPVALSISGLLLTYSMSMVGMMQVVVKYLIEVNNSMSNTERLFQYTNSLHQEAPLEGVSVRPTWPEHGAIEYEAVQMRYRPGLPLVVDDFCLKITGGERLGIVGRTGAGKSTILSTLFRLTEISGGRITIDGVDIGQIGLHRLRSALAIIPQDPTLFQGTIRSNLDPFNRHTDLELWNALRESHLVTDMEKSAEETPHAQAQTNSAVEKEDGDVKRETRVTLETVVESEGLNFSLGQRQLIALARALLRDTRIVLVDEGTSSVDPETDALVQETLATGLGGKTLIAIAHRLRTVIQYDRVCVMDKVYANFSPSNMGDNITDEQTNGHTNGSLNKIISRPSTNGFAKNKPKWQFDTIQIHAGLETDTKYGHCTLPIYNTASFKFGSSAALNVALSDISSSQNHLYTRVSNPTHDGFEKRIAALEDGRDALAFSSGSAAVLGVIASLAGMGDNAIVSTSIHSGTYRQFRKAQVQLGIESRLCDINDIEHIKSLIDSRTKFIFCESLGNPMFSIPDFEALAAIAHSEHLKIPLVVDATLTAAGYFCQPAQWGADILIHSATKWIGGHGTTLGGLVIETGHSDWQTNKNRFPGLYGQLPGLEGEQDNWYAAAGDRAYMQYLKTEYMRDTGACLGPFAAQQLFIGVETLSVRCERQSKNAETLARWLRAHPRVAWVRYLGFPDHPHHKLALKYFRRGFGTVITFGLKGGAEEAVRLIDCFDLIINTTNVGDSKTLVGHHWSTTHKHFTREENVSMGVYEDLVRLSLGIEDARDVIADFEQAFERTGGRV